MSKVGVNPSSIPSCSIIECWIRSGKFQIQFWGSWWLVVAVAGSWFGSSVPKLVYRSSESFPKFEVRIRCSSLSYEWGWSLSIECSFLLYNRMLNSKRPVSDPILGVVVARSSRSRFMVSSSGTKLVYRSSESFTKFEVRIRLQVFIVWVRLESIHRVFFPVL